MSFLNPFEKKKNSTESKEPTKEGLERERSRLRENMSSLRSDIAQKGGADRVASFFGHSEGPDKVLDWYAKYITPITGGVCAGFGLGVFLLGGPVSTALMFGFGAAASYMTHNNWANRQKKEYGTA